ncbi:putative N-succinyldiaminopimelate aminotransferase DapC [bacterium BMS3Abin02]|nr:putative N-succinyldiaminopimelate aminotransferase DapC [bacterium BMS3Abin02]GBE22222.1 putative N-succinyldiaminopimelate aminotransferase DapC [bacterium BMS3Bbin01]HDH26197.1 aminotransferase class I/II-fold pyridoxal phosphate-dependent enzyme [Actinomycetota bacterium]HDL49483.1 aminotransferase class I/II-fold pyridoxal phosphate-dependent enzyme [Actinomycetota bacterium]
MQTARRLQAFGQTIFTEISRLALDHDAVNLGQGFPNFDGPDFVKDAAITAIRDGRNQYAPLSGVSRLRSAIADRFSRRTGIHVDPDRHVTVTSGCTEALTSAFLGLVDAGDEVVLIEPFYDSYPADLALAGATPRFVTLRPPDFALEEMALRAAFSPKTRAILLNTPHNPTGRVFSRPELETVASLCKEFDAIAITDEVYEDLVFEGTHISLAQLEGMWERTITLSSLGKTFSLTGWKVGWAVGPDQLTAGLRAAHQFVTFATATPLQHAAATALRAPDAFYSDLVADYRRRRDLLTGGLVRLGFEVFVPEGTYFILADHTRFGFSDDVAFARHLVAEVGVAVIPPSAFYHRREDGSSLVRFAFCKDEATIEEALHRMASLR